ncbi:monothiol glutaredoxin, Grx4 family [Colwellia sp. MB3u-22]|nr:monothiol glutaredoxin, Grx4 family [Colwellia sp. MB02u-7]MBA6236169.1 monothiol glutaredoxin, Grx4 family [Colwellia sp. MB02u-11]MBA6298431.1 monothiol glutaredoxin, Grx4 family [Colwellia sp. MB3u-22]MBA6311744.1 monothiol glutaredoxin, Grx4 family [Colwellia sp. MB3u-64]
MDIMKEIEEHIDNHAVVIFMKGTSEQPLCGFSAIAVKALITCNENFVSVDILANQEIRAALPVYGDWPIFPQVWANGQLIGDGDIISKLNQNGELKVIISAAVKSAATKQTKASTIPVPLEDAVSAFVSSQQNLREKAC